MRVLLVHNATAGAGKSSASELTQTIRDAGHEVRYLTKDEISTDALRTPADLIAVAGGDGTVAEVLTHLPDAAPPVAVIPLGTANNIAATFGVAGTVAEVVRAWSSASPRRFDLWEATGPWGRRLIVEGCGLGVLTKASTEMSGRDTSAMKPLDKLSEMRRLLDEVIRRAEPVSVHADLDGEAVEGDFVLFEVLNTGRAGPGLTLAPDADPGDGLIDVVLRTATDASMTIRKCERLRMTWRGGRLRLDDEFWPDIEQNDAETAGELELRRIDRFATILVPPRLE